MFSPQPLLAVSKVYRAHTWLEVNKARRPRQKGYLNPAGGGQLGQQRDRDSGRQDALQCFVTVDLSHLQYQCPASFQRCSHTVYIHIYAVSLLLGKLSDVKSTWSSGPASHTQASLSHELWKVPRNTTAPTRPPPGLANPKPSSTWGTSPLGWTSSYSSGKHCSGNVYRQGHRS